jgi:hypothetical protein
MNRYISQEIRLKLRQEVNWGCPVPDCGSPFLSYHHFDPSFTQFRPGQQHDPNGMVALCLAHAKMADTGVWTNEQLREMKRFPLLASGQISGRLEWLRRDIIVRFGGLTCVRPKVILEVHRKPFIWINRDTSDNMLLNIDIPSNTGSPLLRMESNDWHICGDIANLEAKPGGRSIDIHIPKDKFLLNMQFRDLQEIDLRADVESKVARKFDMNQKQRAELRKSLPPAIAETLSYDTTSIQQELEAAKHDSWQRYLDCVTSWPVLEVSLTGHLSVPEPIELSPRVLCLMGNKFIEPTSFDGHVAIAIT